jgi:hypothetical protein
VGGDELLERGHRDPPGPPDADRRQLAVGEQLVELRA